MKLFSALRAVLACLLAVILASCVGGSVDPARQAAAKRIGVVSVLGDRSEESTVGLDAAVSAHAADRLRAAHPVSAVVDLQAERPGVSVHTPTHAGLFDTSEIAIRDRDAAEAARRLAARHALDLVVMVLPSVGVNSGAGQPPNNPGCGVWAASLFGAHISDANVYANFAVEVFDGATGQRLAFKLASVHKIVDDVSMRRSSDAYSPGENARLAEATREVVLKGLDEQLVHLHLTRDE